MLRRRLLLPVVLLLSLVAVAKEKKKVTLPYDVMQARTVLVVIQPGAGEPVNDPTANRRALEDVESALTKWHRFSLVMDADTADLVIAVRKGTGRAAGPTIQNSPVDNRPVIFQPSDGGVRVGGRQGRPPDMTGPNQNPGQPSPGLGSEIGPSEDTFEVYRGNSPDPLRGSPVWRYMGKDGLRPPLVPAVEEFRKALDESEKAAAQKKQP